LVKDVASYAQVQARLREACVALKLNVLGYWPSVIAGGDGNKEFWIGARRA
jgi:23S rRNA (cytidine1920-2'-O)/16S rRNA (cytidine1409-2'-O)-methyltransferase